MKGNVGDLPQRHAHGALILPRSHGSLLLQDSRRQKGTKKKESERRKEQCAVCGSAGRASGPNDATAHLRSSAAIYKQTPTISLTGSENRDGAAGGAAWRVYVRRISAQFASGSSPHAGRLLLLLGEPLPCAHILHAPTHSLSLSRARTDALMDHCASQQVQRTRGGSRNASASHALSGRKNCCEMTSLHGCRIGLGETSGKFCKKE